jgi:hypothetical protein
MEMIISQIDETVAEIKAKDDSKSFNVINLRKFEFILFLTLDVVRYEIILEGKLSDLTSGAISRLFAFHCFEFYYRDFPEVYIKTAGLFSNLCQLNLKLANHDLDTTVNGEPASWLNYFTKILNTLILKA